jgi:hypothetical protein
MQRSMISMTLPPSRCAILRWCRQCIARQFQQCRAGDAHQPVGTVASGAEGGAGARCAAVRARWSAHRADRWRSSDCCADRCRARCGEHLQQMARAGAVAFGGELRLGVPASLGPYLLPHLIEPFPQHFPGARLGISEGKPRGLLRRLHEGELDAVLAPAGPAVSGIAVRPLFFEPWELMLRADHPLAGKRSIALEQLDPAEATDGREPRGWLERRRRSESAQASRACAGRQPGKSCRLGQPARRLCPGTRAGA